MDMKRIRKPPAHDPEGGGGAAAAVEEEEEKAPPSAGAGGLLRRAAVVLLSCLMLLSVLAVVPGGIRLSDSIERLGRTPSSKQRLEEREGGGFEKGFVISSVLQEDMLLNGLLASGFDEGSCLSRYQSALFRKVSPFVPSPYLVARLRKYEALHRQCGPSTEAYNKTVELLSSPGKRNRHDGAECNYLVWISYSGLGNKILSLASAFLYALLTNRVLLVDRGVDMVDLFCEPFPETSWLLPPDFPINRFDNLHKGSRESFGNILKENASTSSEVAYIYLHLSHDYDDHDKLFFCDKEQSMLRKTPWLVLRSNNYFVPSLFLMPGFDAELGLLFPDRDTVFHHLGRYLVHPANSVWGLVKRYHMAYLAKADERIGLQIRVFETEPGPFQHVWDQILACSLKEKLLPDVSARPMDPEALPPADLKTKAVLLTSLSSGYYEKLRDLYWESPSAGGYIVSAHQPSHEGFQQTEKGLHNRKAFAEMYLLSMTEQLVTSSWSTFGYVAQGLGGLRPWILVKPENRTAPDPPCRRAMSMEPCFHAPPLYDCKARRGADTGEMVPHVRHCEDMSWGLKLVDQKEW